MTKSTLNGSSTTYEYDNVGNITKSTMANGTQSVSYEYDQLNRPTKYTDALGQSETYTYNNAGDMTSKKDRNGLTTSYTYDALHRLIKESVTKDGKTNINTYIYALTGQLVSESNESMTKTYKYSKFSNTNSGMKSEENVSIDGKNYRFDREYNKQGMVRWLSIYIEGWESSIYKKYYHYDSKGRLYRFSNTAAYEYINDQDYTAYYTYDKNDNITSVSVKNNNSGGDGENLKLISTYSYNDGNMLTSLVNKNGSGATLSTYSYSYNLDGNINKETETGKVTTYTYDGANRLTGESIGQNGKNTNMAYTYDAAGNRLSLTVSGTENYVTTYSYDANNRLVKSSKKESGASYSDVMTYIYDNNGNQIRIDKSRDEGTGKFKMGLYDVNESSGYGYENYTYDGFNQLIKYNDEKNNTAVYEYMSNGLRLSKTVNGEKTSFLWDGDQMIFALTDEETRSYAKAPGYMRTGTRLEGDSPSTSTLEFGLYLFNGHGDVTGITDKNGELQKTYEYDAFGNEINPDSSDTNPFRYCGEYYDSETESIYLRARYYNMSTGRFISEDPIKDGLNWYAYCGGNPVMFWDINGLSSEVAGVIKGTVKSFFSNKSPLERANDNYEYNRWLTIEYDTAGKINGQGRGNTAKLRIGDSTVDKSGCEMIAVYNAVTALGYETTIQDVLYYFDSNDYLWNNGHFGVNPYDIDVYIEQCGFSVEEIDINPNQYDSLEPRVYLYSYHTNDGGIEGKFKIHTIMINKTGPSNNNKVYATNIYFEQEETKEYPDMTYVITATDYDVVRMVRISK